RGRRRAPAADRRPDAVPARHCRRLDLERLVLPAERRRPGRRRPAEAGLGRFGRPGHRPLRPALAHRVRRRFTLRKICAGFMIYSPEVSQLAATGSPWLQVLPPGRAVGWLRTLAQSPDSRGAAPARPGATSLPR